MRLKAVPMATCLCAAFVVLAAGGGASAGGPMPLTPGKGEYCSNCHKGTGVKITVNITSETATQRSYSVSGSTNVYSGATGWGVFNAAGTNVAHGFGPGQFTFVRNGQTYRAFWVNDGSGRGGSAYQDITVNGPNRAPELSPIGNKAVDENQPLSFTVSASDLDGTTPSLTASNLPPGVTFTDNGDGTALLSWTPTYEQAGVYPNVHFEASDGELIDSEEIVITVNNVNRAPELSPIGNKAVDANQPLSFTVSASDPDGTTPSLTASNLPQGASFTDNGDGTGSFAWTPTYEQAGVYPNVHFEASDGELSDSEDIVITVLPPLEVTELSSDPAGNVTVRWQSVPGRAYTVQYADWGGGTLEWQIADANYPGSEGDETTWTDDGTKTPSPPSTAWGRFYRIQVNP